MFMGSVLVARSGKVIFSKSYGMADLEWSKMTTPFKSDYACGWHVNRVDGHLKNQISGEWAGVSKKTGTNGHCVSAADQRAAGTRQRDYF